ncbi:MAG TPA: rhomboid family intramembrane serine protease [Thermoanaerobaculaceae bacterium]|nr:rhomboid family intramembrane serine protease [Thermoanaerobaculaceae bacterium]HRS17052.1 rhomboid family intramembrane serine protease [Thermoanaerobaculaceae bacterium]
MLIPIGLDQTSVRRWPWISIGLVAINVLVFLSTALGGNNEAEIAARFQEMLEYWRSHPYLELPREMRPENMDDVEKERFDTMVEFIRSAGGAAPEDPEERARQRADLDSIVQRYRDALDSHPFRRWGLVPAHPRPAAFLTSMFIHGGWLHLLGNMLILWLAGPFLEDAFGRPLFSALYLLSGLVAAGAHIMAFPGSNVPLGGASGAIAGLMGAFLIRYALVKIRFFYWFFLIFRGTFDAPAWLMLPLWLLQQLFFASMDTGGRGGVAYWAHIGGFVFGAAVAFGIKTLRVEEKYIAPAIEAEISVTQHPALEEGMQLFQQGEYAAARETLSRVLRDEPRNPDANLAMWNCHLHEGQPLAGVDYMARVIEDELKHGEVDLALANWRELLAEAGTGGPGPLRFRLAAALEPVNREAAVEVLQQLAGDGSAGLLAEKAARRLEALGARVEPPAPSAAHVQPEPPPEEVAAPRPLPPPPVFDVPQSVRAPAPAAQPAPFLGALFEVEDAGLISVQEDGLVLHGGGGGTELLPFYALRGVVVSGISAQPRPYLLIDLLLKPEPGTPAKVVRVQSTEFDPRRVLGRPDLQPMAAFKEMVSQIVQSSSAIVWPQHFLDEGARPTTFPTVESYELQVLTPLCES